MKTIIGPIDTVRQICSRQQYHPGDAYRMTVHCLSVPCDEGTLLFHTLTGELCLLEAGETAAQLEQALVERRFMVPEGFDDQAYALELRKILSLLHPPTGKRTSFTILTTTDCNARCFYCYELGCRRITMSETVARDTADYIARVSGGEDVKLSWFGGEPLFNARAIDVICERLTQRGVTYSSSIVSNGYLFDEAAAERAERLWRLQSAQITVDGTKERYQKTKAFIYHDDCAYERVMRNIDNLLSHHVRVHVRLNMNRENADDLFRLSEELAERFKGKEGFSAYPVLLKEFVGKVGEFQTADEAVTRYFALQHRLSALGLFELPPLDHHAFFQRCMADNDACEVIHPDGKIGKCEHFDEADVIGSIDSDERDRALIAAWKEPVFVDACRSCPIQPRCLELKKCAWSQSGCTETVRRIRTEKLRERILIAYEGQKA